MSDMLTNAADGIRNWNLTKQSTESTINYFNQGCCFEIHHHQYQVWHEIYDQQDPTGQEDFEIHGYLAIHPNPDGVMGLALYCVDSYTDSLDVLTNIEAFNNSIQYSPFLTNLNAIPPLTLPQSPEQINHTIDKERLALKEEKLTTKAGLERYTSWNLYKNEWIAGQTEMTTLFRIPFKDLKSLFDKEKVTSLVAVLGLTDSFSDSNDPKATLDPSKLFIELILWGKNAEELLWIYPPKDFIEPCPPYCEGTFNLLEYAL